MDYSEKQELLGKMLQNLAEMRHEMLKAAANRLEEEEASEDTLKPKSSRRRRSVRK